jgi:biotin carboxylase
VKKPSILVLGAGRYYTRVLSKLREADFTVFAIDRDPQAPGFALADDSAPVDIANHPAVVEAARAWKVDGVLPINDVGVRSAAAVVEAMGLRGPTRATAELANDKGLMRERWRDSGLPVPEFRVVHTLEEAHAAMDAIGLPVVVKPADSGGGGRGVSVVRASHELAWAVDLAQPFARNGRILVESFLDGTELTVESLSFDGDARVLAMSDKVKAPLRTRVATSLNYSAAVSEDMRRRVEQLTASAVTALGVVHGPAHTEIILTRDGPFLVETGARGGGGHLFHTIVQAVSGVDFVAESARVLTGGTPRVGAVLRRGCVYRFFNPPDGILRGVHGVEGAAGLPGVLDLAIVKELGSRVGNLVNSLERVGYVVTAGDDRDQAIARADAVEQAVRFDIEPTADASASSPDASSAANTRSFTS